MKYFFLKTLRDILKAKGQFVAITLVIAVGVSMFVGLMVLDKSLNSAIDSFYETQNLSDFIINFSSVDEAGVDSIRAIEGVENAQGRLLLNATKTNNESSYFVHSIPQNNVISMPRIVEGRLPQSGEIIVDRGHANATKLSVGDSFSILIDGKEYEFSISGIFISPEYIYLTDSIQNFMPNHAKFGAIFTHDSFVLEHFGAVMYNQVLVKTNLPLTVMDFEQSILAIDGLSGYGFLTPQEEVLSVAILKADTSQLGNMGVVFAVIFFIVAAVIILISMSRSIALERNQIGIMKAIGQKSTKILTHYLSKSIAIVLFGCAVGVVFGVFLLPGALLSVYASLYTLPDVAISGYGLSILMSVLLACAFALAATLASCRKVLKERPSDAMRPLPPKKVKPILLEKNKKLWAKMSYSNKLILRNIFANKTRAALSSIGVIACVGLIIASFSLLNMFSEIVDNKFVETNTHDLVVQLAAPLPQSAELNGIVSQANDITKQASVSASFSKEDKITKTTLISLNKEGTGITLYGLKGEKLPLPDDGILLPKLLSDSLKLSTGDYLTLRLMLPLGASAEVEVRVGAVYMAYLEQNIYSSLEYMNAMGVQLDITALLVSLDSQADKSAVVSEISANPMVHSVLKIEELIKATRDSMSIVNSFMAFMIVMSAVLALTVIYNITAINISERRRDIATLKVLGYRAKEVNRLIFVENLMITAFGAIIGIGAGAGMLKALLKATMPENMMIPYSLSPVSIIIAVALGFGFTMLANLLLKRNTKKIDMVESLKSTE